MLVRLFALPSRPGLRANTSSLFSTVAVNIESSSCSKHHARSRCSCNSRLRGWNVSCFWGPTEKLTGERPNPEGQPRESRPREAPAPDPATHFSAALSIAALDESTARSTSGEVTRETLPNRRTSSFTRSGRATAPMPDFSPPGEGATDPHASGRRQRDHK
ncbi:hypothetical protein VUR80DRAFT_9669 [Thermomyces stellatus]